MRSVLAVLLLLPALALAQPLAITGVTVIDTTGGAPRPGMTVVIEGERIAALGPSRDTPVPEKARVVHGAGKFLIPGLWDMHVHWQDAPYLPLFIATGVTGMRVMWGQPRHLDWRKQIAAGELIGPRLVIAGSIVDGPKPFWQDSIAAGTVEQGRSAVRQTKAEGYDFVKVYSSVPRPVFFAIADEARKQGIRFAGHVPGGMRVHEAADAGQHSMEHLQGLLLAVSAVEEELRGEFAAVAKLPAGAERAARNRRISERALETYDARRAAQLFEGLKANGTWQVPTFTVLHSNAFLHQLDKAGDSRLRYMPAWVRTLWKPANDFRFRDQSAEDFELGKRFFQRRLEFVGEMHRAGVGILAGSDALNPYCFPGFSLHDELGWLVKAGLSPMAALQTATRNPALYLERGKDFGSVEPGKIADLVLLDADPTRDIGNTRKIAAVIHGGKLFSREALDHMLGEIERMAGTN
jgi:imidazolonepropionase-like amidohydrolase